MKKAVSSIFLLAAFVLLAPFITSHDPLQTNASNTLAAPSLEHFLGTDNAGRDVFSRTLYGGQTSILTATLAAFIAITPALILGILAGISPKWLDRVFVLLLNTLLAFPPLLLALVLLTLFGRGIVPIALATGLAQMPQVARLARALIQQNQHHGFVQASIAAGSNRLHRLWWHLLPTVRQQILAYASVTFSYCLINSAALSLLGLGADPSIPDWGVMLATSRESFRNAPWGLLAPAIAISLTVILVNKIADSFSD